MIRILLIILCFNLFNSGSTQSTTQTDSTISDASDMTENQTEGSNDSGIVENQTTTADTFTEDSSVTEIQMASLDSETTKKSTKRRKLIDESIPKGVSTTPKPSSIKTLVIVIIVILSLLILFALFLCYWFCIRRIAPREDASTELEDSPQSPEVKSPDTKSLTSDQLDLSIRSDSVDPV